MFRLESSEEGMSFVIDRQWTKLDVLPVMIL